MSEQADRADRAGFLLLFRVLFNEDRTRVDTDDDVMGWGVRLPDGQCYVYWNLEAFPPEDRLDNPHVSIYGSFEDVNQGTGGDVDVFHEQTIYRTLQPGGDDRVE